MKRAAPRVLAAAALTLACAGTLPDMAPGANPALDRDEAGFKMIADNMEKAVVTSAIRVPSADAEPYLKRIVCRVSADYCDATRVYLVRTPEFNAAMYPNGMIHVYSGLLLRVHNEAQLAAVLGHEVGHYQRRHMIARYRNAKAWSTALTLLMYGAVGAGGNAGAGAWSGATLIAAGSLAKYSRSNEAESDAIGLESLAGAGYDPREAAKVWRNLLKEQAADPHSRMRIPLLESHPAEEARMRALEQAAAKRMTPALEGATGEREYREAIRPLLDLMLSDEIAMRRSARTEVVLSGLLSAGHIGEAEHAYYRAELARLRDGEGDADRAVALYREAIAGDEAPPIAYRNLGLLLRRKGDAPGARECFEKYVTLVPAAPDRAVIDSYLGEALP